MTQTRFVTASCHSLRFDIMTRRSDKEHVAPTPTAMTNESDSRKGHNTKMFEFPFKIDPVVDAKRDDPVWRFVARGRYLHDYTTLGRKSGRRCVRRLHGKSICGGSRDAKEYFLKSKEFKCPTRTPAVCYTIWAKNMDKCSKEFVASIEELKRFPPGHPCFQWPPLSFPVDSEPRRSLDGGARVVVTPSRGAVGTPVVPPAAAASSDGVLPSAVLGGTAVQAVATTIPPATASDALASAIAYAEGEGTTRRGAYKQQTVISYYADPREHAWRTTIMRFIVESGMPFHCVKLESFRQMFTVIIPPGVPGAPMPKPPTYHMVRTTFLDELDADVQRHVKPVLETSRQSGCIVMTDGWTNILGQTLCNYIVGTERGPAYLTTDVMRGRNDAAALVKAWLQRLKTIDIQLSDITAFVTILRTTVDLVRLPRKYWDEENFLYHNSSSDEDFFYTAIATTGDDDGRPGDDRCDDDDDDGDDGAGDGRGPRSLIRGGGRGVVAPREAAGDGGEGDSVECEGDPCGEDPGAVVEEMRDDATMNIEHHTTVDGVDDRGSKDEHDSPPRGRGIDLRRLQQGPKRTSSIADRVRRRHETLSLSVPPRPVEAPIVHVFEDSMSDGIGEERHPSPGGSAREARPVHDGVEDGVRRIGPAPHAAAWDPLGRITQELDQPRHESANGASLGRSGRVRQPYLSRAPTTG
ncbi:hypothetical protein CBR_g22917 [Chara braunii]|uniref:DUF659 domain-containing protein n=1 Tax=Chara braunii TaxID=69332 RepID=A0A388L312_CHABU|nr:hypothetical protein CBR_g22917 [Chara braunii]|eukprot:GBG76699.1 hypothetical protein CBR_g22917 [Chara braunii]